MPKTPEASFYEWIKSNLPWFFQRIETTTGSGIPDIWAAHSGRGIWIETKACPKNSVAIRSSQYAWMCKVLWNGVPTFVWNRNPKRKTLIQIWVTPFDVEPMKKEGYLRITSEPYIETNLKDFPAAAEFCLMLKAGKAPPSPFF